MHGAVCWDGKVLCSCYMKELLFKKFFGAPAVWQGGISPTDNTESIKYDAVSSLPFSWGCLAATTGKELTWLQELAVPSQLPYVTFPGCILKWFSSVCPACASRSLQIPQLCVVDTECNESWACFPPKAQPSCELSSAGPWWSIPILAQAEAGGTMGCLCWCLIWKESSGVKYQLKMSALCSCTASESQLSRGTSTWKTWTDLWGSSWMCRASSQCRRGHGRDTIPKRHILSKVPWQGHKLF